METIYYYSTILRNFIVFSFWQKLKDIIKLGCRGTDVSVAGAVINAQLSADNRRAAAKDNF